jgi:hypothetical protein
MGKFEKRNSGQTQEPPTIRFDTSRLYRLTTKK